MVIKDEDSGHVFYYDTDAEKGILEIHSTRLRGTNYTFTTALGGASELSEMLGAIEWVESTGKERAVATEDGIVRFFRD